MAEEENIGGQNAPASATIPQGEAASRDFVQRTIANSLALQKAEFDLQYRIRRYNELAERYREARQLAATLKRQMQELNLPPQLLRQMKLE